jgi:hypothetical protein
VSFDRVAADFIRKRREGDIASIKREQYRAMLKDYNEMKYAPTKGGQRAEREITEEAIERQERRKKSEKARKAEKLSADPGDILDFVDLDLGA